MFFEEITDSETLYKLRKISETLNTVHGVEIDFESSTNDLKQTFEHYNHLKNNLMSKSGFNGYFYDSDYSKSYLICEAIRLFLSEVAPNRKLRKKSKK